MTDVCTWHLARWTLDRSLTSHQTRAHCLNSKRERKRVSNERTDRDADGIERASCIHAFTRPKLQPLAVARRDRNCLPMPVWLHEAGHIGSRSASASILITASDCRRSTTCWWATTSCRYWWRQNDAGVMSARLLGYWTCTVAQTICTI